MKFALRNYAGKPTAFYLVDTVTAATSTTPSSDEGLSHHIIVLDRSGSMYYDIGAIKTMLVKFLTLQEYQDANLKVSLISYSSQGDLTTHFAKVRVSEVMADNSPYLQEIQKIRVTGLTCISQALNQARSLITPGETTAITLHSDGYANDRSRQTEVLQLEGICKELAGTSGVFINTIAYSRWADFGLLNKVANDVSGSCVQALGIKQVFDSLKATMDLLAGEVSPSFVLPIGDADYQVSVSHSMKRVNGSTGDLKIAGVPANEPVEVYRYQAVSQEVFEKSTEPECSVQTRLGPVYAFARAQLAEGALNKAKFAVVSTRNTFLLQGHSRALTTPQIAAFADAIEGHLYGHFAAAYSGEYGLSSPETPLLDIVEVLNRYTRDIRLNLPVLRKNYVSRGLKRVNGKRDETGILVPPTMRTEFISTDPWVQVNGFDTNRNRANINMRVRRDIRLVNNETDEVVSEVAGVPLRNLSAFNNYTVVGNGEVCVPSIEIKISSKKAFRALKALNVVEGDFEPTKAYVIDLAGRPLVDFAGAQEANLDGVFQRVAGLKVVSSIISAILKEESENYTPEQLTALKEHYLTGSLNVSFPSTTAHTDLQQALNEGSIDSRPVYKVDFGTKDILNLSKITSANAYLARIFTLEVDGEKVAKPTWQKFFAPTATFGYKTLSARTKLTAVDDFMKPLFEEFLGLASGTNLRDILVGIGVAGDLSKVRDLPKDDAVELLNTIRRAANAQMDEIYRKEVCPLVFYIGATGLLPDSLDVKAETAEALGKQFPTLKFAKKEKEGTFFQVEGSDAVISIYTDNENFTVARPK